MSNEFPFSLDLRWSLFWASSQDRPKLSVPPWMQSHRVFFGCMSSSHNLHHCTSLDPICIVFMFNAVQTNAVTWCSCWQADLLQFLEFPKLHIFLSVFHIKTTHLSECIHFISLQYAAYMYTIQYICIQCIAWIIVAHSMYIIKVFWRVVSGVRHIYWN